jgi:hypothetical protein
MTSSISGPASARAASDPLDTHEAAVSAASHFLAGTVEAIAPDTPAPELLTFLARYRAHLAAVVEGQLPVGGHAMTEDRTAENSLLAPDATAGKKTKTE